MARYLGTAWPRSARINGGTHSSSGGKEIYSFTSDETFELYEISSGMFDLRQTPQQVSSLYDLKVIQDAPAANDYAADILLIGGGGGAGGEETSYGGGGWKGGCGGAGGLLEQTGRILSIGSYPVVIGSGGIHGDNGANPNNTDGAQGGNSTFDGLTALGGGKGSYAGGAMPTVQGYDGGSGGGLGSWASGGVGDPIGSATQGDDDGATGYGNDGGLDANDGTGGGGGGAGGDASVGTGGAGRESSITGSAITYAVGGSNNVGDAIPANRGCGGHNGSGAGATPLSGGDGVFIISI